MIGVQAAYESSRVSPHIPEGSQEPTRARQVLAAITKRPARTRTLEGTCTRMIVLERSSSISCKLPTNPSQEPTRISPKGGQDFRNLHGHVKSQPQSPKGPSRSPFPTRPSCPSSLRHNASRPKQCVSPKQSVSTTRRDVRSTHPLKQAF